MIALYDTASGAKVGRITEQQLEALMGWMEEESTEDRDYYLTAEDCDLMLEQGIDQTLIDALREEPSLLMHQAVSPRRSRPSGAGGSLRTGRKMRTSVPGQASSS